MKAAIYHEYGGPEVVRIEGVQAPEPGPGEALIEVRAAALNHLDLWVRRGLPIETTMPHIGGADIAGVVLALGGDGSERGEGSYGREGDDGGQSGEGAEGTQIGGGEGSNGSRGAEGSNGDRGAESSKGSGGGEGSKSSRGAQGSGGIGAEGGKGSKGSGGDESGEGGERIAVGDRVVVNPSLWCGHCEWCMRCDESLCVSYRIIGEHTQGGFAEYVVVPVANLLPIPDDVPFEEAAAAPLVFLTAWRGLITRARLRAGESVLVTGASGGVASAALQIARFAGARVYAVTTTENIERVRSLGADVVYDRTAAEYAKELARDTGKRGVDVVLDSVGAATWRQNLRALAKRGRLVTYGATTGPIAETDIRRIFWNQLEIIGTTMSNRHEFRTVMRLVFEGNLRPIVDVVWPLDRARDAHERLERGEQFGKVVLVP